MDNDIDADNLAADFDGSFTGLGVDINTTNYSMSEAMLSLNNIALASHLHTRHESGDRQAHGLHHSLTSGTGGTRLLSLKSEPPGPHYLFSNYGALDLSNDEAQHPEEQQGDSSPPSGLSHPPTFSGSVSRENSQDGAGRRETILRSTKEETRAIIYTKEERAPTISPSRPVLSSVHQFVPPQIKSGQQSVILSYTKPDLVDKMGANTKSETNTSGGTTSVQSSDDESDSRFQYILAAPTSIATKPGEPSLTYINQGQSYEIKIKKLGDLSGHYRKKWLRSTIRICFHERRLQYIEAEQIAEWSKTRPNERILEIDLPLSYGIAEVKQDAAQLNTVSFSWDPTRDTGIFVKVHCISTEFTPKKHGGERGVPFRLQVETWSNEDIRLHAAACILQVFKLKGADRKHKQDRERMAKRPENGKDKFSPQYECTMLTDLSVDSIYIPSSRGISPIQSDSESTSGVGWTPHTPTQPKPVVLPISRDESPLKVTTLSTVSPTPQPPVSTQQTQDTKTWKKVLVSSAGQDTTAGWLAYNRYGQHVKTFVDYDARDLLRLSKDDLVQMIGLVDGVRLFNDLHMKPVAPRLVFYLTQKGESLFHPVLLQDVTVAELVRSVAEILEVPVGLFHKVVLSGPNRINIRLTDEFLRFHSTETAFYFHLVHEDGDACTIHLETVAKD